MQINHVTRDWNTANSQGKDIYKAKHVMKKDHKRWHNNQIYWIPNTKTLELVDVSPSAYPNYSVLSHPQK